MAVSFDLFGTLVAVDRPDRPARAVGRALAARDVPVPDDWADAYGERHRSTPAGAELALTEHVHAALASRGVDASRRIVETAVQTAFTDGTAEARDGARAALAAAAGHGPVGVCSNCSVRGLVDWAIADSTLDPAAFDAVVTSVDCGWRKPDPRAFEALADELGVAGTDLVHVGDDPETDGGVTDVGGEFVAVADVPLSELPATLEGRP